MFQKVSSFTAYLTIFCDAVMQNCKCARGKLFHITYNATCVLLDSVLGNWADEDKYLGHFASQADTLK